jgi:putative salt-induced outer membrane protein YdiY
MHTAVLRPPGFVILCVLSLFASARPAAADAVELKNGDRYSGRVVVLAGGMLKFDTGHGTVDVPWDQVAVATIDTPIVVNVVGIGPRTSYWAMVADGTLQVPPDVTVPATQVVSLTRPAGPPTLTGGANAGFHATSGNSDVTSLRLDLQAVIRATQHRYSGNLVVNRAQERGTETARNATLDVRYDRFVSPRFYGNASAIFTTDRFRDLKLRTALGVALGFQVFESSLVRMSFEGGYGYVNKQAVISPRDRYHAARETANIETSILGPRFVLFHKHDGFFGLRGNNKLFIQTRNGVRFGLIGGLVTTVEGDLDYDHAPASGRKRLDRAFTLTFGYRF